MKLKVFHCPDHLFRDALCLFTAAEMCVFINNNMREYEHVADVEVADTTDINDSLLEVVFKKTNTIDGPWSENEGVTPHKWPCRSTSKGDFVLSPTDGVYAVASIGFVSLATTPKVL